jgi:hypothetical protein
MNDTALLKRVLAIIALVIAVVAYFIPGGRDLVDAAVVILAIAVLL